MRLQDAYALFEENRKSYCSDPAVRNYYFTLQYFFNHCAADLGKPLEDVCLDEIDIHLINRYSIYLKNKSKHNSPDVLISDRTRKDYLKSVSTFFRFLEEYEHLEKNPCDKLRFPKVEQVSIIPLTVREVDAVIASCDAASFIGARNIAVLRCLLDEGMRSGEVQRLMMNDINFTEGYISIRKTKNNKSRVIPLAPLTRNALERYFEFRDFDSKYVFLSHLGTPFSSSAVKEIFKRLKRNSGITRIYPHLLRHTFASSYILGGGSVELLRIYMGHSDIGTTQKYMHVCDNVRFLEDIYRIDDCFRKRFY